MIEVTNTEARAMTDEEKEIGKEFIETDDREVSDIAAEHNAEVEAEWEKTEKERREREMEEARADLDKLNPRTSAKRWVIGKGPEQGGNQNDYRVFTQKKLPWIPRGQFFGLVSRTMSDAIKVTGGEIGGMGDIFGPDAGSLRERGARLTSRDFSDAASFLALAFELVSYAPNFLVDCYCLWLNVPSDDRDWAIQHFSEPWSPEDNQWGLTDEQHEEIVNTFIDQNYEDIRRFFVETLPGMAKRVALHERAKNRQRRK